MLYYRRRYYRRSDQAKFEKAAEMRNNPTRAEAAMWDLLRFEVYRNFPNNIFYRQSVLYGYILDFYCPTLRLGIEVDGCTHVGREDYDYRRDNALGGHGIQVFRFNNDDVLYQQPKVTSDLYRILAEKTKRNGLLGPRFIDMPKDEATTSRTLQRRACFIATAAYGTPMAQEIDVLRRFRDQKMEQNFIGVSLVEFYYTLSPILARVVVRSKKMQAFVRLGLKPIIRVLS